MALRSGRPARAWRRACMLRRPFLSNAMDPTVLKRPKQHEAYVFDPPRAKARAWTSRAVCIPLLASPVPLMGRLKRFSTFSFGLGRLLFSG